METPFRKIPQIAARTSDQPKSASEIANSYLSLQRRYSDSRNSSFVPRTTPSPPPAPSPTPSAASNQPLATSAAPLNPSATIEVAVTSLSPEFREGSAVRPNSTHTSLGYEPPPEVSRDVPKAAPAQRERSVNDSEPLQSFHFPPSNFVFAAPDNAFEESSFADLTAAVPTISVTKSSPREESDKAADQKLTKIPDHAYHIRPEMRAAPSVTDKLKSKLYSTEPSATVRQQSRKRSIILFTSIVLPILAYFASLTNSPQFVKCGKGDVTIEKCKFLGCQYDHKRRECGVQSGQYAKSFATKNRTYLFFGEDNSCLNSVLKFGGAKLIPEVNHNPTAEAHSLLDLAGTNKRLPVHISTLGRSEFVDLSNTIQLSELTEPEIHELARRAIGGLVRGVRFSATNGWDYLTGDPETWGQGGAGRAASRVVLVFRAGHAVEGVFFHEPRQTVINQWADAVQLVRSVAPSVVVVVDISGVRSKLARGILELFNKLLDHSHVSSELMSSYHPFTYNSTQILPVKCSAPSPSDLGKLLFSLIRDNKP